jgi:hypothetical protein
VYKENREGNHGKKRQKGINQVAYCSLQAEKERRNSNNQVLYYLERYLERREK